VCTGNIQSTTKNQVFVAFEFIGGFDKLRLGYSDGSSINFTADGDSFIAVQGTQYFLTFSRNADTNIRLQIFTDEARTVPAGGNDDITFSGWSAGTIDGLANIEHGTRDDLSAGRLYTWAVDNLVIDGEEFSTVVRTLDVTELVDQTTNFIRFNGVNTQFLRIEGSSDSSLVMAANELAVQIESDPPLTTLHGQFTIPTIAGTPLNGGDPTSSVIDDPIINTITYNNVSTPANPELEKGIMWLETIDTENNGIFAKVKENGAIVTTLVAPLASLLESIQLQHQ